MNTKPIHLESGVSNENGAVVRPAPLAKTNKSMYPILILSGIAAILAFALIPVLYRYQGLLSGRFSVLGFTAEIVVDGREDEEKTDAQLPSRKQLDGDAD